MPTPAVNAAPEENAENPIRMKAKDCNRYKDAKIVLDAYQANF